jgi:hypothetical protein
MEQLVYRIVVYLLIQTGVRQAANETILRQWKMWKDKTILLSSVASISLILTSSLNNFD